MDELVKKYIYEKERSIRLREEKIKRNFLINQGLCRKVYVDVSNGEDTSDYDMDSVDGVDKYYKMEPVTVTDEEYRKLRDIAKKEAKIKNSVAFSLMIIGYTIVVLGFCLGLLGGILTAMYDSDFNWGTALICWVCTFVISTMFFGFAEIIKLLQEIKDK